MYKCPFPGCDYTAAYAILNSHAKKHGFRTVQEMTKAHGPVTQAKVDPYKLKMANRGHQSLNENSYNNIDSAIARLKQVDRSELRNR
jgi:hypothetical protein